MATAITISHRHQTSQPKRPQVQNTESSALNHAVRLIQAVCGLAGSPSLLDEIRADLRAERVRAAIRHHNTAAVFDWLMAGLSYQGISNQVAYDYMERHGRAAWHDIEQKLGRGASCPKLKSYWHFHDCRYDKVSRTCAEPDHIRRCPLPKHVLRNGRLNQTAYSLFLFIRDIADGDLIGWIDQQLQAANSPPGPGRLTRMRAALIEPMREIYGVSDKVLAMALSALLLGAPKKMLLWTEVGGSMIAIDTLVHNFLHRTGILQRFNANHLYGAACYRPGGCAAKHTEKLGAASCQIQAQGEGIVMTKRALLKRGASGFRRTSLDDGQARVGSSPAGFRMMRCPVRPSRKLRYITMMPEVLEDRDVQNFRGRL